MLPLQFAPPPGRPLRLLAIGAHPDDIEIGAGGTLLTLAESQPGFEVRYLVLTGTAERQLEARRAAAAFLPGATLTVDLRELPEGRFPAIWAEVKEVLEQTAQACSPDIVLAPGSQDAHQDHRTIAEIVPTVFRDQLCLAYEIPKWDGDLSRPSVYVPLTAGYRPAEGGAAAQELSVTAVPRLVGRRGFSRPGPAPRHGVPGQLRRVIPLLQIYASWRNKPVTIM